MAQHDYYEPMSLDLNRAAVNTPETEALIRDMFEPHRWNPDQEAAGRAVREVLMDALRVIIGSVPPSPDRTAAIRKLREARMDCNSAITHRGRY